MGKHVKAYKVSFNITGSYIQAQPSQIIKRISSIETWDNLICQMSCTIVTTGILSIAFPSINIMDASSSLERHCSCRGAHYCNAACISDGRGGFFFSQRVGGLSLAQTRTHANAHKTYIPWSQRWCHPPFPDARWPWGQWGGGGSVIGPIATGILTCSGVV